MSFSSIATSTVACGGAFWLTSLRLVKDNLLSRELLVRLGVIGEGLGGGGGKFSSMGVVGPDEAAAEDADDDDDESEEGPRDSRDMGRVGVEGDVAIEGCEEDKVKRLSTEKRRRADLDVCDVCEVGVMHRRARGVTNTSSSCSSSS